MDTTPRGFKSPVPLERTSLDPLSRRKTISFIQESQREEPLARKASRASMAPSRSILKGSNDENHTVTGIMQVLINDDKTTSKKFAKRRVSFAPEATLHTFQIDERQLVFPDPPQPARKAESPPNNNDKDNDTGPQFDHIFSVPPSIPSNKSPQKTSSAPDLFGPASSNNSLFGTSNHFAPSLFPKSSQAPGLTRQANSASSEDMGEKDMDLDSTNTSEIFEATKQQIALHEANKKSKFNTPSSPLFTSAMRNSSISAAFNTRLQQESIIFNSPKTNQHNNNSIPNDTGINNDNFSQELGQVFSNRRQSTPRKQPTDQMEIDMTVSGAVDPMTLFQQNISIQEPPQEEDMEEETRDMTQLFGQIRETAEQNMNSFASPMKLSEETASPFRRRSLFERIESPQSSTQFPSVDMSNSEEKDNLTENEGDDMDLTNIPKDQPTRDAMSTIEEEEEDMNLTALAKPSIRSEHENEETAEDMEFTAIPGKKRKSMDNRDPEEDMEFTSVQNPSSIKERSEDDEMDMDFTNIHKSPKRNETLDTQPANNEQENMELTSTHQPVSIPIDEPEPEQTMEFTMIPLRRLSVAFVRDALKRKSLIELPVDQNSTINQEPDSFNRHNDNSAKLNEEDVDMDLTNTRSLDQVIDTSQRDKNDDEEEMEFTVIASNIESQLEAASDSDMEFTTVNKHPNHSSLIVQDGGIQPLNQSQSSLAQITYQEDSDVDMDFTNVLTKETRDDRTMDFTQINTTEPANDVNSIQIIQHTTLESPILTDKPDPGLHTSPPKTPRRTSYSKITTDETPTKPRGSSIKKNARSFTPVSEKITNISKVENPYKRRKSDQTPPQLRQKTVTPISQKLQPFDATDSSKLSSGPSSFSELHPPTTPSRLKKLQERLADISPRKKTPRKLEPALNETLNSLPISTKIGSKYLKDQEPPAVFTPLKRPPTTVPSSFHGTRPNLFTKSDINTSAVLRRKSVHPLISVNLFPSMSKPSPVKSKQELSHSAQLIPTPSPEPGPGPEPEISLGKLESQPEPEQEQELDTEEEPEQQQDLLKQFLQSVKVNFLDSLLTSADRSFSLNNLKTSLLDAQNSIIEEHGQPTLKDYAVGLQKLPQLEMYKFSTREMRKSIKGAEQSVKDMELDIDNEPPKLFTEYVAATPGVKDEMSNAIRVMKSCARLKAKGTYIEWNKQLMQNVIDEHEKNNNLMESDRKALNSKVMGVSRSVGIKPMNTETTDSCLDILEQARRKIALEHEFVKTRLERLHEIKLRLNSHSNKDIDELKSRFLKAKTRVTEIEKQVDEVHSRLAAEETHGVKLSEEKESLQNDVRTIEATLKNRKLSVNKTTVNARRDIKAVQLVSGTRYLKAINKKGSESRYLLMRIEKMLEIQIDIKQQVVKKCTLISKKRQTRCFDKAPSQCLEFFASKVLGLINLQTSIPDQLSQISILWRNALFIDAQIKKISLFAIVRRNEELAKQQFGLNITMFGRGDEKFEYGTEKRMMKVSFSCQDLLDSSENVEFSRLLGVIDIKSH